MTVFNGPVQIWRETDRGCIPVATALDPAAVKSGK